MKITSVTTYVVKVSKAAYLGGQTTKAAEDVRGTYTSHKSYRSKYSLATETLFVKVETDAGLSGWGEAQAPLVPEAPAVIVASLIAPFLIGKDPFDVDVLWNDAYDGMRERGHTTGFMLDAIAACDIALWDIMGKALEKPVHKLLGGSYRDKVWSYVSSLPGNTPKERADLARAWRDKGYDAFKLALGYGHDEDVAVFSAVREAVGEEAEIMVDAHWLYTPAEAIRLGRALHEMRLFFFEAPIPPEDWPGQVAVTAALEAPVAVGEELRTRYQFRDGLTHNAFDVAQPDVGRMGITEMRKVANMCEAFGKPIAPHLGVGLGVYAAASIQLAASINNYLIIEFQPSQFEVANRLLKTPLVNQEGYYDVPQQPGLGVEMDEEKLKEHTTAVVTTT